MPRGTSSQRPEPLCPDVPWPEGTGHLPRTHAWGLGEGGPGLPVESRNIQALSTSSSQGVMASASPRRLRRCAWEMGVRWRRLLLLSCTRVLRALESRTEVCCGATGEVGTQKADLGDTHQGRGDRDTWFRVSWAMSPLSGGDAGDVTWNSELPICKARSQLLSNSPGPHSFIHSVSWSPNPHSAETDLG